MMDAANNSDLFNSEWSRYETCLLSSIVSAQVIDPTGVDELIPPLETAIPTTPIELEVVSSPDFNAFKSGLYHPRNSSTAGLCAGNNHLLPDVTSGFCERCGVECWNCVCPPQWKIAQCAGSTEPSVNVAYTHLLVMEEPQVQEFAQASDTIEKSSFFKVINYLYK